MATRLAALELRSPPAGALKHATDADKTNDTPNPASAQALHKLDKVLQALNTIVGDRKEETKALSAAARSITEAGKASVDSKLADNEVIAKTHNMIDKWDDLVRDCQEERKSLVEAAKAFAKILATIQEDKDGAIYEAGGIESVKKMFAEFFAKPRRFRLGIISLKVR